MSVPVNGMPSMEKQPPILSTKIEAINESQSLSYRILNDLEAKARVLCGDSILGIDCPIKEGDGLTAGRPPQGPIAHLMDDLIVSHNALNKRLEDVASVLMKYL